MLSYHFINLNSRNMLYAGKNVQSAADMLMKVDEDYIYNSIRNPKAEVVAQIKQLRIVRTIDAKRYSQLKRQLPYLVCGCFNPPYRKKENFAYIEHFIVDIDHLSLKGLDIASVRDMLKKDNRVAMLFVSPGEDGLKVLFNLKERCYDAGMYSLFYKAFVRKFGERYGLDQVVDGVTCDVSRACFISVDPEAYYNPMADCVDMGEYVEEDSPVALFDLKKELDKVEKTQEECIPVEAQMTELDPDKDTLKHIKEVLSKNKTKIKENIPVFVPQVLDEIIDGLKSFIEKQGISVYEIVNIQYAKKIRCKLGARLSEINLFYGKRGFNVVQSPKSGTSQDLNEMVAGIVSLYITENCM